MRHYTSELNGVAVSLLGVSRSNPWLEFLYRTLDAWRVETGDAEVPVPEALEFIYETCAESRRDFTYGQGVNLSTVHAAKGTEYDHVLLIGAWPIVADRAKQEEARRVFYVGMTRARQTLAVVKQTEVSPSLVDALDGPAVFRRRFEAQRGSCAPARLNYAMLGLEDMYLGFPGLYPKTHPIHAALANLRPGDRLVLRPGQGRGLELHDQHGTCVARLSRKAESEWASRLNAIGEIRVLAVIHRSLEQEADADRRKQCRVEEWEIPVVEVVFEETTGRTS